MKVLILAGGKGTRLGKKIKTIPKPMIKIGGLPILEHQINLLKRYGLKEIVITTQYLSEVIKKYFKDGGNFGVKISYLEEEAPLGTAGGLKEMEDKLKEDFIVLYGDIVIDIDIARLLTFHKKKGGICTLVLHPNDHPQDSDLVEIDENQKIIAFHSKPHSKNKYFQNLVNAGLYVLSPKILKYIKRGRKTDFGKDIFTKIIKKERLYGYLTAEYLKDMGTITRLNEVSQDWQSGRVKRLNRENKRRAIFLDRDGVINDALDDVRRTKDFKFFPGAAKSIKKINQSEFLAIIITNQPVVAKGLCSREGLKKIHNKMETLLGREGAKIDAIYFCPHHPDKGFPGENLKYKIKCNCRKPKIGLVKKAEKNFNIDLKRSYFIGDSFRDILCGEKAGTSTVCVKTGKGCKDREIKPDYLFANLNQAVNFIINKNK